MRLALIGPRGAGKTTVAALLSERIGLKVVATDRLVEERIGDEIEKFVRAKGWSAFREIEKSVIKSLTETPADKMILDCGGGAVLDSDNRALLAQFDEIVYLKADAEVLVRRLEDRAAPRTPITDGVDLLEEVRHILARRDFLYRSIARHCLDTTSLTPVEVADQIVSRLESGRSVFS